MTTLTSNPMPTRIARSEASPAMRRMMAGALWAVCSIVLGIAAWLTPSPTGMGTHTQLNLPQCGWIVMMDLPCPTCGMTTAFAYSAHGDFLQSLRAQPMGFLLSIATAMAWLVSLYVVATGSRVAESLSRLWGVKTAWLVCVLFVAGWGITILRHKGWL